MLEDVTLNRGLNTWKHLDLGEIDSGRTFQLKEILQAQPAVGKRGPSICLESLVCVIWKSVGHAGSCCKGL